MQKKFATCLKHNPHAFFKFGLVLFFLNIIYTQASAQQALGSNGVSWSVVASQPYTISEAQGKVVNGKLYTFGGFDSQKSTFTPTKRAYVYNPVTNLWSPIADLPYTPNGATYGGVTHAGITTDGTDIFMAGGYTSNSAGTGQIFGTKQVWRYNVAQNDYTALTPLPEPLSAGQLEYLDGRLHYIGGTNAARTEDLGAHYVLDLNNTAAGWVSMAPLPNPRHHGGSAVFNGKIYFIGGQHEHDTELVAQKDVHCYDPVTDTWIQLADLPVPSGASGRGHITSSVAVMDGRIIVLGGETVHASQQTNMVSAYAPQTNTWENLTPLPLNRFSGVAGFLNNSLYYTTGSKTSTTFKGVPISSGTSNIISLSPLSDAFVRNGTYAGTNYGSDTSLLVKIYSKSAGYTRSSYLKFSLGSAPDIVSAKLRIYGRNTESTSIVTMSVFGVDDDSWTETGVTLNNAPAVGSAALSSVGVNNQAQYYELDVTNFVKDQFATDKIASFFIKDTINQNQLLTFSSKENAANPPQLVISTTTSSGTLTFSPGNLDFSAAQYGTTANQDATVSADAGSPAISLTKPLNSNWLILPSSPAIGPLSFGIDASGLMPGTYTTTVTAAASGYSDATLKINLVVSETMVDTTTLTPLADALIRNGTQAVYNFGSDTTLQVKTNNRTPEYTRSSYLKFSLTGISDVVSAKLRLYGRNTENTTAINMLAYGVANDSWTEGGITWNNAPGTLPVPLSAVKVNNQEQYYELDVTEFIKGQTAGDKIASIVIKDTANQNRLLSFKSKEYGVNQPQLVVTTTAHTETPDATLLFTQSSQSAEIEQGGSQTLLEYISTSDTTPVAVQLHAIDGNGSIPDWLSVNGQFLNGTAYTTGSEISFEFDATNLSIGKYSAQITASAPGYASAVLNVFLTVKAGASGPLANLKVNFQDSVTLTPTGWLRDFGQAYGPRTSSNQGTGNVYGWIKKSDNTPLDLTKNGRKRTSPSDVLLATLIHMQGNHLANFSGTAVEGVWEAQVGNGNYDVTVSVGDGSQVDSKHFINIEGVPVIVNFVPTTSLRFKTATVSVSVADGFLTVDAARGTNTKINWITIQPTTTKRPSVVRLNPENSSQNVSENTSISTSILNLPNGGVNNATITAASVYLTEDATGAIVPSTVNGTGGGDAITLVPAAPLKLGTTYVFTITDSVKDLSGASFIPYSSTFTTGLVSTGDLVNAKFDKIGLPNAGGRHSSLTIGPDGKLYALSIDGVIKRFSINADGTLGDPDLLYSLQDASGTRQQRLAIGFAFDPAATAANPIVWITHSSFVFLNAPDWDGKLTRLAGPNLENVQDVLINLPRSAKDHLSNSIAFGPDNALYFTQGSNSAMGRADKTWNNREEHLLSAAVLRLDLAKLGTLPLDVKTTEGGGTYDPYAANAPLTIYASGVRNAYDLVWHTNGQLYVPTNGSAAGGNTPASVTGTLRPDGTTYNGPVIPALTNVQQTQKDFLFRVESGGYYGHPNALRGEYVMNGGNPTSSIDPAQVDSYPLGTLPDNNWRGHAFDFQTNKSPNGAIEYKSNIFNGILKGKLLVVRYSQNNDIITLTPGGNNNDIVSYSEGTAIEGFTGFVDPLDLTEDARNGNIYVSEYGGEGSIILLRPRIAAPSGIMTVTPDKVYENGAIGGNAGPVRTITVKNSGTGPLSVSTIALTGSDADQFILGGLPTFPVTINAQDSLSFTVAFQPSTAGLKMAGVGISGNDSSNPKITVPLRALGTTGTGGTNEPSLQALFDLLELPVSTGDDDPATTVVNSNTSLQRASTLGEEVAIQKFVKADTGNVTIEPLAVFGPTASDPVLGLGWYKSGDSTAKQQLLAVSNNPVSNGQTVNVNYTGTLSFDPGMEAFGFYSNWPFFNNRHLYSEDHLNTFTGSIPHHVRVYPYKNKTGVVPNTYIVAFEEHTSGFDYQDVVFIVRNVQTASSVNVVVAPLGDAYVRNGTYAGTNYGADTSLLVKVYNSSAGYTRSSYLKFPLSGISDVVSAKLRIYGRNSENATPATISVFGVQDDTWGEMNITLNNAPAALPGALGAIGVSNEAKYYELDVTEFIKSQFVKDKTASFLIKDSSIKNTLLTFNSKEHPLNKPQLVLTTSSMASPSNSLLFVENLDRFPDNERFVASRIQIPWTRDTTAPYVYNANHDTVRVRIHNKGINPLIVSNLILSNKTNWRFLKLKGIVYDSATTFPLSINSGTFADLTLQFIAPEQNTRIKQMNDILTIISNDDKTPAKDLLLSGLWQQRGEGSREPRAQEMINAFGFKTRTGFTSSDPDDGSPSKPKGDEIISSYFVRANPDIPVTVTQMGAYHGCCRSTENIQWFAKGGNTFPTIFTHLGIDGQTLLPRRGTPATPAENIFNPATAFGFRVGNDYTDTLKNPDRKIGIRVWKAIDANGKLMPNTYIIANDYLGTEYTNYDYNDNMYLVRNIKPEFGTVSYSELTTTPSAVDFDEKLLASTNTFTLNLKNLGQVYANGSSDPALVISAVTIRGENSSEFTASMPFKTTLSPQDTTNITIGFNPVSEGLKVADLLIYCNNSLSPHRVPLYGIAKASGTTVTAHYRINSGSTTAKVINGKNWSADQYAFDNLEPYTNPKVTKIAATDEDDLYIDEQSSNADKRPFRYELPVANGNYVVRLHFGEIYWGMPGSGVSKTTGARVMSVNIENQLRLANFDVVQEVGSASAIIKNFPVTVTDGKLNINFSATVNRPMVSAVEVYSFSAGAIITKAESSRQPDRKNNPEFVSLAEANERINNFEKPMVYPNPLHNKFNIEFPAIYKGHMTLQIADVSGRIYDIGKARLKAGGSNMEVNLSKLGLKPGVYLLKMIYDERKTEVVKLLIE